MWPSVACIFRFKLRPEWPDTLSSLNMKHDFPTGTIRNPDGRKARKDKTLGSLRKDSGKEYR